MKKLKLDLQSLNAEVLTRSQLKQILGGDGSSGGSGSPFPGGCCVHTSSWNGYQCSLNYNAAQTLFDNGNGGWDNWCCDSCASSWYTQYA